MPNINEFSVTRKQLVLFYVLDTSGSMKGNPGTPLAEQPITKLNQAMRNTIDALSKLEAVNEKAELKVAVLQFGTTSWWVTPPVNVKDYRWQDVSAGTATNVGTAIDELVSKMTPDEFLNSNTGSLVPAVIFMTDGRPTDPEYWPKALDAAKQNPAFRMATKIGFAITSNTDDPDEQQAAIDVITELTGSTEHVLTPTSMAEFVSLIEMVSVRTSQLATQGKSGDSAATEAVAGALGPDATIMR